MRKMRTNMFLVFCPMQPQAISGRGYDSLREQGDAPQAGPFTLIPGPAAGHCLA